MNTDFLIYDDSGRILMTGSVPGSVLELQASPGRNLLEGAANAATDYVAAGEVLPRPLNPTTLAGTTLTNVPIPATVKINGTAYPTNEATVVLDLTYPSTYEIVVSAFPYLDKTFTVTT
jgi:hypothetical protein